MSVANLCVFDSSLRNMKLPWVWSTSGLANWMLKVVALANGLSYRFPPKKRENIFVKLIHPKTEPPGAVSFKVLLIDLLMAVPPSTAPLHLLPFHRDPLPPRHLPRRIRAFPHHTTKSLRSQRLQAKFRRRRLQTRYLWALVQLAIFHLPQHRVETLPTRAYLVHLAPSLNLTR